MMKDQAIEIAIQLGNCSFPASNGWLDNFRKRYRFSKSYDLPEDVRQRLANGEITVQFDLEEEPREGEQEQQQEQIRPQPQRQRQSQVQRQAVVLHQPPPEKRARKVWPVIMKKKEEDAFEQVIEIEDIVEDLKDEDDVEGGQAEEEEMTEVVFAPEFISKGEAMDAYRLLVSYFEQRPPPQGTLLSLQRVGDAIHNGDDDDEGQTIAVYEEVVEVENASADDDDNVSIEVEIEDATDAKTFNVIPYHG